MDIPVEILDYQHMNVVVHDVTDYVSDCYTGTAVLVNVGRVVTEMEVQLITHTITDIKE